jgi:hypothetical protein
LITSPGCAPVEALKICGAVALLLAVATTSEEPPLPEELPPDEPLLDVLPLDEPLLDVLPLDEPLLDVLPLEPALPTLTVAIVGAPRSAAPTTELSAT